MSRLKILNEKIDKLESYRDSLNVKIYKEMVLLIKKFVLNDWYKVHKADISIIDVVQNSSVVFSVRITNEISQNNEFFFRLNKHLIGNVRLQDRTLHEMLVDPVSGYMTSITSHLFKNYEKLIITLLYILVNNMPDILNTYDDLYNYPIIENKEAAITTLCIYYYRVSPLDVFPKDMITLICKEILKWDI